MGRVDRPIIKPLPYFGSFLSFWKKFITTNEPSEDLQFFWNSNNKGVTTKKQEEDELVQGEKKHLNLFQISYLVHSFINLSDFCCIGCVR